jgi:hypothetical protein
MCASTVADTEHCSACGRDCDFLRDTVDGYTDCCNKTTCSGRGQARFACTRPGQDAVAKELTACCVAKADAAAKAEDLVCAYRVA